MAATKNAFLKPADRKRLQLALQELLMVSPDFKLVERAIADAEARGFSGDELSRAKERLEKVRSLGSKKKAKKAPPKKYSPKKRRGSPPMSRKTPRRTAKRGATVTTTKGVGGRAGARTARRSGR